MGHKETIYEGILKGNMKAVEAAAKAGLAEGIPAAEILNEAMIPGMAEVGRLFEANEYYVPEMLIAARAMKAGLAHLEPVLAACGIEPIGTYVIGTVKGDIHDIGKNLVGMMLRGAGFRVIDLGVNTPLAKFQAAIEEHRPEIVGMSALLTTTMGQMKVNIEAFRAAELFDRMRVMVGGAAVSEDYAATIGAHAYGKDAPSSVARALELLAEVKATRS